ncbi:chemotaxis protein CheW [filamentous cyanobacterium LEGE 11480]|uniref:Chemotaxis protein CheW n=1 Tax=Romeriopsis navalis LEGE 11480 TaxID=2777977 RepID=A0A928VIM3_9CYAN|nr:chemotaxis protein CheW [Romeriopsis navalis]MBE9029286.1 chemotaxis protein CheW [Romeriopsis navalis LEGE 11480]
MTTSLSPPSTSERLREESHRYLSVYLPANRQAILPTDSLIEVLTFTPSQIISIPDTPSQVMGVCNWRGEVLWLVDAGHFFDATPSFCETNYQTKFNVVVLKRQNRALGLVVERVGNMLWCHPSEIAAIVPELIAPLAPDEMAESSAPPGQVAALDNMATRCLIGSWADPSGQDLLVLDAAAILNLFV